MNSGWWRVASAILLGLIGVESRAEGDRLLPAPRPPYLNLSETQWPSMGQQATPRFVAGADAETAPRPPVLPGGADPPSESETPRGEPAMTLAELEALALANNPTLIQAEVRIRAARAKCLQVGLSPNPVINYEGEGIGSMGGPGEQGGGVGQEIVTAGKLRLRRAVVAHEIQQAEHARWAQRGRVLNDLRQAWYDVLVAQRAVELNRQLVDIGQAGLEAAEKLLAQMEVSRVDLLQARIESDSAKLQLNDAENRRFAAWRRLAAVLGIPDMEPVRLAGDLPRELPQLTWQESLRRLLAESPELAEARSGVERARCAVARECAQRIPNLEVAAGVKYQSETEDTVVGVLVGLPIPIFDRNQGNIFKARAELIAAENEVRRVELELQDRLANVFQRYADARHQVDRYGARILPDAKDSLELVAAGYRQGEFDYLTLLTAQRTYTRVSLAYLESLREVRTSGVLIDGLLLTGGLHRASE